VKIVLRLTFADGTIKDVVCNASDLVAFENEFDVSVATLAGGNTRISHLLWLAWHSQTRTKATALEYEAWLDTIESVEGTDSDPK
jgi:hypothetical protein